MKARKKTVRRGWVRTGFRWTRILCLSAVFLLLAALLYFNQVGLPDFLKLRLVDSLKARGLDVAFDRLRLDFVHGLVVESLRLKHAERDNLPDLRIRKARVDFNNRRLLRGDWEVESLDVIDGGLSWTAGDANAALRAEGIESKIRFPSNQVWEFEHFQGSLNGVRFVASGTVTNTARLKEAIQPLARHFKQDERQEDSASGRRDWAERLLAALDRASFEKPPEIKARFFLDGAAPQSSSLSISAASEAGSYNRVYWDRFELNVRCLEPDPAGQNLRVEWDGEFGGVRHLFGLMDSATVNGEALLSENQALPLVARFQLAFNQVRTRWADLPSLTIEGGREQAAPDDQSPPPISIRAAASEVRTQWCRLKDAALALRAVPSAPFDLSRFPAEWTLDVREAESPQGTAGPLRVAGRAEGWDASRLDETTDAWAYWKWLAPVPMEFSVDLRSVDSPLLRLDHFKSQLEWTPPDVRFLDASASLYGGTAHASGRLNVEDRWVSASGGFDFDAHELMPLLNDKGRGWLSQYEWDSPPSVQSVMRVRLPEWDRKTVDWDGAVRPTFYVNGTFDAPGGGSWRGVSVKASEGHFIRTNSVWHLPRLLVQRPEGDMHLQHRYDPATKEYWWKMVGALQPQALKPALPSQAGKALNYFQFHDAPRVDGTIRGYLFSPEKTGFSGRIDASNFQFKTETAERLSGLVDYTNQVLNFYGASLTHDADETIEVQHGRFDARERRLYLTNAVSTMDPHRIARGIGPNTARRFEPYRFPKPPKARVNGFVDTNKGLMSDLRFKVEDSPFGFWKLNFDSVGAELRWTTNHLTIADADAEFHGGQVKGNFEFEFNSDHQADLNFEARVQQADLNALMRDLVSEDHPAEGVLSGTLEVKSGKAADLSTWAGEGSVRLREGNLWDVPLFSVFTPVLNIVYPGLGSSRGGEAKGDFTVSNGRVSTENLEMREPALRLAYEGSVDLQGNLDARVEAEILRDAWVVGRAISTLLMPVMKIFEYQVTGSLSKPKIEPRYFIPRFLLAPLRPMRMIERFFETIDPDEKNSEDAKPDKKEGKAGP